MAPDAHQRCCSAAAPCNPAHLKVSSGGAKSFLDACVCLTPTAVASTFTFNARLLQTGRSLRPPMRNDCINITNYSRWKAAHQAQAYADVRAWCPLLAGHMSGSNVVAVCAQVKY